MSQPTAPHNQLSLRPARLQIRDDNPYARKLFLIIDNVPDMQRAISMTLATFGANKVEYANRASDALAKLARFDFDVVLCDYDLGNDYDGLYLFQEAKERNLLKPSSVFMIITAEARVERVISAAELAPDGYLLKPFTGEKLRQRLDKAMRKRDAFKTVDQALMKEEYLTAMAECDRRIGARDEFMMDFLKLKGSLALKIGDHLTGKSVYEQVLAIKALPWAQLGLAKSLTSEKDYPRAKQLFEEVLDDNPRVMECYDWLARIYESQQDPVNAKQVLQQATQLSSVVVRRQRKLAEVSMKAGDFSTAQSALSRTIDLAKYSTYRSVNDYAALARAQLAAGETKAAQQTSDTLRREFRHDQVASWVGTVIDSQIATQSGQPHRGRELIDNAIEKYRDLSPMLNETTELEFVRACYHSGREDVAVSLVQQIVKNNHDDELMLETIEQVFRDVGRAEDGKRIIAENVQSVVDLNNEAVRRAQAGQLDEAVALFNKAVAELPSNMQIMLNAVNAILAFVHRKGWHESHVSLAHDYLEHVRHTDPANVKFQRLLVAYRTLIEKHGKTQWML